MYSSVYNGAIPSPTYSHAYPFFWSQELSYIPDRITAGHLIYPFLGRNVAEAVSYWSKTLELKPDHAEAHYNLGERWLNREELTKRFSIGLTQYCFSRTMSDHIRLWV